MKVFVAGGTGKTGRLVVQRLLEQGNHVVTIVRCADSLLANLSDPNRSQLTIVEASLLALSEETLASHVAGCEAIVCCLGHNLSLKGVFGPPYRLVTQAVQRLCRAAQSHQHASPIRFVLMNSAGVVDKSAGERVSIAESMVLGLLRVLVPPHADNEQAVRQLRRCGSVADSHVEWVAVRPDSLIDAAESSSYEVCSSPVRSAIFNAGITSRANVAHFIVALISDDDLWQKWKTQMPVIYNKD